MKVLPLRGAATGLFAGLAVCIVSGLLLLRPPRTERVPEASGRLLVMRPPGSAPEAAAAQKSPALAPPLPLSAEETSRQLQLQIERALVAIDDAQRERAYTQLLPQLIAIDPAAMKRLVARCPSGPVREELLRHTARTWSSADMNGAIAWAMAIEEDGERFIAAREIISQRGQADPAQAIEVSDLFGIGRNDGTVEHIALLWAAENLNAALRWILTQPPGTQRDQLLARINTVQAEAAPADAANIASTQISPGPLQDDAVVDVVRRWSLQNPDAASEWVRGLPQGRLRELAEAELALSTSGRFRSAVATP